MVPSIGIPSTLSQYFIILYNIILLELNSPHLMYYLQICAFNSTNKVINHHYLVSSSLQFTGTFFNSVETDNIFQIPIKKLGTHYKHLLKTQRDRVKRQNWIVSFLHQSCSHGVTGLLILA